MAFKWTKKSAEQGDSNGQFGLCQLYGKGTTEIKKDYNEALNWCLKSAEQGNWAAQALLAGLYASKMLGKPDFITAYKWFLLAKSNINDNEFSIEIGNEGKSQFIIKENKIGNLIEENLTPDQFIEAKKQAKQWQDEFDARRKKEGIKTTSFIH